MKPTDIPFFQTVIIMSLACDLCGYKSNEVKSGGAIKDQGCRLSVKLEQDVDLARDVLKTDTCALSIPEIDLEVGGNALCGRFTTIEGLLTATKDQLDAVRYCGFGFLRVSFTFVTKSNMRSCELSGILVKKCGIY